MKKKIIDQNRSSTMYWFDGNTRFSCAFFIFIQIMFISSFCICWSFRNTTQDNKHRIYNEREPKWSIINTKNFVRHRWVHYIIMFQCWLSLCTHCSIGFLWKRNRNEEQKSAVSLVLHIGPDRWSLMITAQVISFGMSVFLFGMETVLHTVCRSQFSMYNVSVASVWCKVQAKNV